jgi:hypothetical protein
MTKATRTMIPIGPLEVEGFMLPDGTYRMSLSQAAEIVGLIARNAFEFLESKAFKTLAGEGYTVSISEIEAEDSQGRGGSRIRSLPLDVERDHIAALEAQIKGLGAEPWQPPAIED